MWTIVTKTVWGFVKGNIAYLMLGAAAVTAAVWLVSTIKEVGTLKEQNRTLTNTITEQNKLAIQQSIIIERDAQQAILDAQARQEQADREQASNTYFEEKGRAKACFDKDDTLQLKNIWK